MTGKVEEKLSHKKLKRAVVSSEKGDRADEKNMGENLWQFLPERCRERVKLVSEKQERWRKQWFSLCRATQPSWPKGQWGWR